MEERIGLLHNGHLILLEDYRLNPYCNGRKNRIDHDLCHGRWQVLILIVMEERIG